MRDYQITSPSLAGVLNHDSVLYEGIRRPVELLRVLDGPASRGPRKGRADVRVVHGSKDADRRILEQYSADLYGVFMKKLSIFMLGTETDSDESVKLQAMLQEMIKVKTLLNTI